MEFVAPIKSKDDIKRLKAYFKKKSYRDYFLFTFGINVGLRASDLVKLKVKDVKDTDVLSIRDEKTGKINRFPLIPELQKLINEYIEGMDPDDYLFPSQKGGHIGVDRVYIIMRDAGCALGIPNLGSHSLRKTFGYWFYMRTKDIATLQEIFNHSSQKITLRYLDIDTDFKRQSLYGGFL